MGKEIWRQVYICKFCGQEIKNIVDWGIVKEWSCKCGKVFTHVDEMILEIRKEEMKG